MDISHIFEQYTFVPERALAYGFRLDGGAYLLQKPLRESGFYAVFRITGDSAQVNVYEEPDGELYLPFNAEADVGGFVSAIRANVGEHTADILSCCFALTDVKALLLRYVNERYGTVPETPWGEYEAYCTLNTARRHKWYGLFMLIPYRLLGLDRPGKINVLNLKAKPEDIARLVDNERYFPAYHMNKKHWMTVLLDRKADVAHIEKLLDDSYALVEGNR